MDSYKNFFSEYKGAIIGGIVALVLLITKLHELIIGVILVFIGIIVGNYIQKNKFDVKEKIKKFIDRI